MFGADMLALVTDGSDAVSVRIFGVALSSCCTVSQVTVW